MDATKATHRLGGPPSLTVHAKNTKDHRHSKTYWREIQVVASALPADVIAYAVAEHAKRLLPEEWQRFKAHHNSRWHGEAPSGSWTWKVRAERPSKIIPEAEAEAIARDVLVPALIEAMHAATDAAIEKTRRETALKQATRIADWAGMQVYEKALAATRYDQRLAALDAELKAEVEVQAETFRREETIDKAVASSAEGDEPETFEPEAVEAAKQHFVRFAGQRRRRRLIIPSTVGPLKLSDLFEDEEQG
jgi:hypothetical protein